MRQLNQVPPRVAVVGAGPAGCAAAYTLARESIDVTIFERGQPGKDKACGDALVPSAVELISHFGIGQKLLRELGGYSFDRASVYADDLLLQQFEYKNQPGWVIPRAVIDQEIRNMTAKYASFQYETFVTDLNIKPDGSLALSLKHDDGTIAQAEYNAVIIATGSMNRLSEALGIDGRPFKAFAASVYAELQQPDTPIFQFTDSCKPGYRWIYPISERIANIGVCTLNEKPKAKLKILGEEFLIERRAVPTGRWRSGWGLLWSGLGKRWHHLSGIVSCGDAAGLINPYSGEGMTAALKSGEQAGRAILEYLSGNRDPLKLVEYSKWILEHSTRQYRLTPSLQVWNGLCGNPRVSQC